MTRAKSSKFLKVIATLSLALILCLGTTVTAFAAPPNGPIEGTEAAPAQAAITKMLVMPEGTITPTAVFKFDVVPVSVDGDSSSTAVGTMPKLGDSATPGVFTINFSAADVGTTDSGIKSVPKESAMMFTGVTWPHAGVYVYKITEQANTNASIDAAANTNEELTYSAGEYEMTVYVENGTSGNLFVAAIGDLVITPGAPGQQPQDKVDPTPGGNPSKDYYWSQMIFTNRYLKHNGGIDPTDPDDSALSISKVVTGQYANLDKYFTFSLELTKPATESAEKVYKVYVVEDATGTVVTSADNFAGTIEAGGYFNVTTGAPVAVKLKHGQRLAFMDIHVGASYEITEAADADYKASLSIVVNGGTPVTFGNSALNTALSTQNRLVGENTNKAEFKNEYKVVNVTGLDVNDLPFIMILVLAAGAVVAFVVVSYRKKARSRG